MLLQELVPHEPVSNRHNRTGHDRLDRYSEDFGFSLLKPSKDFSLGTFGESLMREVESYGFEVDQIRQEVAPFVKDQRSLDVWSRDFFHSIAARIVAE